jgi:tRNA A-37 threonylcarbamoyl transferase component Bud32/predicted  nucleic acid-binding Zn-ribbon protein
MKVCPRCSELYPDDVVTCPHDETALKAVLDPLVGKTVGGRFRLIERLGTGGMSSVYLARHVLIDRLMAIKTLRRDLARDPIQRDRFLREARAVNRINHDNIVEITDYGETEDGLVYLVMEYVPGEPLLSHLADGPFPALRALDIAEQCLGALGRAHQMGVIHRDLKPENILIVQRRERRDFVKILDFGIAKILGAPSLTGSQQIFGTPGYIAPEYIQSSTIDGRADLYSIGCVLYEMVTGALPFDYEYPSDLLVKHVTEPPVRPSVRLPMVEPQVEELILQALAKDPAQRFRDAFHFKAELAKVRERLGPVESRGALAQPGEPRPLQDTEPEATRPTAAEGGLRGLASAMAEIPAAGEERDSRRLPTAPRGAIPLGPPSVDDADPGERRRGTKSLGAGLAIPVPPALDGAIEPDNIDIEPPPPLSPPTPVHRNADGLVSARRWRQRLDAIRPHLAGLALREPAPASVAQAMALAALTLDELEASADRAQAEQEALEALHESARDFRATVGRTLDELAGRLSAARGDFESLATRRNSLRARREAVRVKVRRGMASEGEADALLWELAAVEEELRRAGQTCDELETQLADLTNAIEAHNEGFDRERATRVAQLDARMVELETRAAALRRPLELAEAHVRSRWPSTPSTGSMRG